MKVKDFISLCFENLVSVRNYREEKKVELILRVSYREDREEDQEYFKAPPDVQEDGCVGHLRYHNKVDDVGPPMTMSRTDTVGYEDIKKMDEESAEDLIRTSFTDAKRDCKHYRGRWKDDTLEVFTGTGILN